MSSSGGSGIHVGLPDVWPGGHALAGPTVTVEKGGGSFASGFAEETHGDFPLLLSFFLSFFLPFFFLFSLFLFLNLLMGDLTGGWLSELEG